MTIGPESRRGDLTPGLADGLTHGHPVHSPPRLPPPHVAHFLNRPPHPRAPGHSPQHPGTIDHPRPALPQPHRPPSAAARGYSRIPPDTYGEWFLPFAQAMLPASGEHGNLVLNIKNRVANRGPLKGQRHPYVYQLVLALQEMGWRWIETYIWAK